MIHTEILIIGAGPTGLFSGLCLLENGIKPILVDHRPSDAICPSKALVIHSRTMECFKDLGLMENFLKDGLKLSSVRMLNNSGEMLLNAKTTELSDGEFNYMTSLPQFETERILRECFLERGGEIVWGRRVDDIMESVEGVVVVGIDEGEKVVEMNAKWVMACDGASSSVRKIMGVTSTGNDMGLDFTMISCAIDRLEEGMTVCFSDDGITIIIEEPSEEGKRARIIFNYLNGETLPKTEDLTLDFFQQLIDERCPFLNFTLSNEEWMTNFHVYQRYADQFRSGRVFFLGDSAHSHSPIGGKGMNTGLQDAFNLGWKLSLVIKGIGRSVLIDSYHEERQPIASSLIDQTGKATLAATTNYRIAKLFRDKAVSTLGSFDFVQRKIFDNLAMEDLSYSEGSIILKGEQTKGIFRNSKLISTGIRLDDNIFVVENSHEKRLSDLLVGYNQHYLIVVYSPQSTNENDNIIPLFLSLDRYRNYLSLYVLIQDDVETDFTLVLGEKGHIVRTRDDLNKSYGDATTFLIIRPDKYISLSSHKSNDIHTYLDLIFY